MSETGRENGRAEKTKNALNFPLNAQWSQMGSVDVTTSFTHIFKSFKLFSQEGPTTHSSGLRGKESHPLHFQILYTAEKMVSMGNSSLHSGTGINGTAGRLELKVTAHIEGCPGHNVFLIF